jgi:FkbM family methyltransferase
MTAPIISYAQRYEDLHLLRCFAGQSSGCYIDIGAGHPVYDNVSFAFYLQGWSGITVEPNPWLAQLSAAVRPRDRRVQALVGAASGEATYYLVEHFHGLSTTIEGNARAAEREFGKRAQPLTAPVTTLKALCEQQAASAIDFLKIDVEGAEQDVLAGADWQRFRPKVVVVEALAPVTLAPAWTSWESILTGEDYRFAFFDGLNRYYVAAEHSELGPLLANAPAAFDDVLQLRNLPPALENASHPDHRLARIFAGSDMIRLPLLQADRLCELLAAGLPATALDRAATGADIAAAHEQLFGGPPATCLTARLHLSCNATMCELYRAIIATDQFRAACGRISASYAW